MRIFYAAGNQPHGSLTGSKIWYNNLYLPLCDLGHEVIPFKYDLEPHYANADETLAAKRQFIEIHRPELESSLLQQIEEIHRKKPIDLFFSYFYSAFVRPEVIHEIRKKGIITINWYCNASYQFHLVEEISPAYNYCLVPEKFRLEDYRRIGANPIYCQEAANPTFYKPYNIKPDYDVSFIGAQYGNRARYIQHLLRNDIDIHVWGPGWNLLCSPKALNRQILWYARRVKRSLIGPRDQLLPILPCRICGEPLTDDEMVRMYSRSKISLGFSDVGETHLREQPIKQVRLRDFEAPMSGAFYMTEYMDELTEFFEPDKEIIFYTNKEDLVEKIIYYLDHGSEREKIRSAGYLRALNDHTWHKRFQNVFKQIGLS